MALSKARELNNTGISPAYWRVSHVAIERHISGPEVITVYVQGWINETARNAEKRPLITETFQILNLAPGSDLAQQAYEALKLLPEWEGATDV